MPPSRFLPPDQLALLAALWASYGAIHSALASQAVKRYVARRWPAFVRAYRLGFNALAVLLLIPPLALTYALGGPPLWQWTGALAWLSNALAAAALAGFVWTARHYDMREFLGIAQWQAGASGAAGPGALHFSPLHRFVRHPWYFLALVILWTRDMDAARLISTVVITAYFWIGSRLEERKLITEFGDAYLRYRSRVAGLFPLPWRRLGRSETAQFGATPQVRGETPFPRGGGGV